MKRYLLYVTLPYAYSILRPLEHEIRRRGGEAAWFIEEGCPVVLEEGEVRLGTIREAVAYNPVAVFAPGNYIPDFIPGVKVALFHGYAIQKRIEAVDDHFHGAWMVRHLLYAGAEQHALFQGTGKEIRLLPGLRDRLAQSRHLFLARSAAQTAE